MYLCSFATDSAFLSLPSEQALCWTRTCLTPVSQIDQGSSLGVPRTDCGRCKACYSDWLQDITLSLVNEIYADVVNLYLCRQVILCTVTGPSAEYLCSRLLQYNEKRQQVSTDLATAVISGTTMHREWDMHAWLKKEKKTFLEDGSDISWCQCFSRALQHCENFKSPFMRNELFVGSQ